MNKTQTYFGAKAKNRFENKRHTWNIYSKSANKHKLDESSIKDSICTDLPFDECYWKIQTDKIMDNNNLGIGSLLKVPTMGTYNVKPQKQYQSTIEDLLYKRHSIGADKQVKTKFAKLRGPLSGFTSGTYLVPENTEE